MQLNSRRGTCPCTHKPSGSLPAAGASLCDNCRGSCGDSNMNINQTSRCTAKGCCSHSTTGETTEVEPLNSASTRRVNLRAVPEPDRRTRVRSPLVLMFSQTFPARDPFSFPHQAWSLGPLFHEPVFSHKQVSPVQLLSVLHLHIITPYCTHQPLQGSTAKLKHTTSRLRNLNVSY